MRLLRAGSSSRVQQLVGFALLAWPLGCSIYDDGLGPPRDPIAKDGAGGSGGSSGGNGGASSADGRDGSNDAGPNEDAALDTTGAGGSGGSAGKSNVDANSGGAPNDAARGDAESDASRDGASFDVDASFADTATRDQALVDGTGPDGDVSVDRAIPGDGASDGGTAGDGSGNDASAPADVDAALPDAPTGFPVVGIIYNIVAEHSGKCMTVLGNLPIDGTNILQWSCDGSASQRFRLQAVTPTTFVFVHPATNKCVDVEDSGTADGTNVALWTCNNTGAQSYVLSPAASPGYFTITNTNSAKCVDVNAAGTGDLADIQIYTCNGAANQSWQFVDVAGDR